MSDPFPLKSNDAIEFGIDIMNDDGVSVMYNKVACTLVLWDPLSMGPPPVVSKVGKYVVGCLSFSFLHY
jgi:hypothetical protein